MVQRQIPIHHSAIVQLTMEGYLVEAYDGDLSERIRGLGIPDYVARFSDGRIEVVRGAHRSPNKLLDGIGKIVRDVRRIASDHNLPDHAILELASDGKDTYILQLNFARDPDEVSWRPSTALFEVQGTPLEPHSSRLGLKGAAMTYFHQCGLFSRPLCVIPPNAERAMIAKVVASTLPPDESYTVRFSQNTDLGLPRGFLQARDEIADWILANRKGEWATMVTPQINVHRSFELYIAHDRILLEHVPGMWESDNVLNPDVMLIANNEAYAWRYTELRTARYICSGTWSDVEILPLTMEKFQAWAEQLIPIVERLRIDFAGLLPLNFHFVEDKDGHWYFLNIRPGFEMHLPAISDESPHVVSSVADLDAWNGRSPILMRFTTARGAERQIVSIADRLPKEARRGLLVDFGLLSHPAMILRELGFQLVPSYLYSEDRQYSLPYEKIQWNIDHGDDPIQRIRRESPIYLDSCVRVVADKDQIVPGHLLVLAEGAVRSFSDGDYCDSLEQLVTDENMTGPGGPWFLVERGRARFCTSGFTGEHAHGHLLPAAQFDTFALGGFVDKLGAERQPSLDIAMKKAKRIGGEYFLIVAPGGEVYLRMMSPESHVEKRLIRTYFSGRAKDNLSRSSVGA